jgi:6-phosphogluconolactonase
MPSNLKIFPAPEALSEAATVFILELANTCVRKNGRFSIALSGGSTPEKLFKLFAESPYREQMPWRQSFFFWGDERCVPLDDPQNNAHQAHQLLFDKIEIPLSNVVRILTNLPPTAAADAYEEHLKKHFGEEPPRFDLILLGMGDDGHTASLFPGTDVLQEETRMVKEVYVEKVEMHRVTMTAPLINLAHQIVFLVTGAGKAKMLKTVLQGERQPELYPAQLIEPVDGELIWMVDEAAAALL